MVEKYKKSVHSSGESDGKVRPREEQKGGESRRRLPEYGTRGSVSA